MNKEMTGMVKRSIVMILIMSFLFSLCVPTVKAEAKAKISNKKVTLLVGEKKTLSVSGTKKTVSWSSSDVAIASVSQNGVVTAISAGKAVIYAKVGKKTLKSTIKVKKPDVFEKNEVAKKISIDTSYLKFGLIKLTNNSKYAAEFDLYHKFYDSSGVLLNSTLNVTHICIDKGKSMYFAPYVIPSGRAKTDCYIDVDTVKNRTGTLVTDFGISIKYEKKDGSKRYYLLTNSSKNTCYFRSIIALYKKDGKIVSASKYSFLWQSNPDETVRIDFSIPSVSYDDVEIVIDYDYKKYEFNQSLEMLNGR